MLLVDRGLEELPADLAGACRQVTRVDERSVPTFSVARAAVADDGQPPTRWSRCCTARAHKIAVVFDFIPMHYPTVYLRHFAARAEYAAALDALRLYDEFVCISHLARAELAHLPRPTGGGPGRRVAPSSRGRATCCRRARSCPAGATATGPIVVMTGDEPRKNTFGALAAIGAATAGEREPRDVVVIGMAGQETRVHHWSIAAAMRPGEARTVGRISDEEMHALLADASLVVVASFDEGLSLPVIEALRAGAPVVASDIPAHRELIGTRLVPRRPGAARRSLAKAIRRHRRQCSARRPRQMRALAGHRHEALEDGHRPSWSLARSKAAAVDLPAAAVHVAGRPLRVGIGTPWAPQRSGVADFSTTTTIELARLCDVTVYTTADADVPASTPDGVRLGARAHRRRDRARQHRRRVRLRRRATATSTCRSSRCSTASTRWSSRTTRGWSSSTWPCAAGAASSR